MFTIDDRFMNFAKGWFVLYQDGTMVYEDDINWNSVVKKNIKLLGLKWYEKTWTISGKSSYIQFKRGMVAFSPSGGSGSEVSLYERCIGYYDEKGKKVIYRVNDTTGVMAMEVREG
jgi:hypothetical protein